MTTAGSRTWRFARLLALKRARQLQRHQEVGGLPDSADQVVRHVDQGGLARARADGDVVEAELPGVIQRRACRRIERRRRSAACSRRISVQVDDGEEVLVPANRDPVLGDAAEAGEDPLIQLARRPPYRSRGSARSPAAAAGQLSRAAARSSGRRWRRRRSPR